MHPQFRVELQPTGLMHLYIPLICAAPFSSGGPSQPRAHILQSHSSLLVSEAARYISQSRLKETQARALIFLSAHQQGHCETTHMMHGIWSGFLPFLTFVIILHLRAFFQVMYSQDKHGRPSVVETNTTSLELSLPVNQDYVIQIKPFSEGGEGSSSRQITIPKIAGGTALRSHCKNRLRVSYESNTRTLVFRAYEEVFFLSP